MSDKRGSMEDYVERDVRRIKLRVRPRWRRVFYWPRMVYRYWINVGIPLRVSIRMANMAVMHKGRWVLRDGEYG